MLDFSWVSSNFASTKILKKLKANIMMDTLRTAEEMRLITEVYEIHRARLADYIARRVNDAELAEDIVQDAFVRILELRDMICETTVVSFMYSVARNLVIDHLRRKMYRLEANSYMYDREKNRTELPADRMLHLENIKECERMRVESLPEQRRKVYCLSRYEDKTPAEIAEEMNLRLRTVETHLMLGRRDVRTYLKAIGCLD